MNDEARRLIEDLGLRPHPEGGYFCETYRSPIIIPTPRGQRRALTSIYYLLADDMFSAFHRLAADEIWHHYRGSTVAIDIIEADGHYRQAVIGGARQWQAPVCAGAWFAAHLVDVTAFALVGCDVGPGFEYEDFEVRSREELVLTFPQHRALIERWTRS